MEKADIKSMTMPELEEFVTGTLGEKKFRAAQIYDWMHGKLADDFADMSNLSLDLRRRLAENSSLVRLQTADKLVSRIDGTAKYLFRLPDDRVIESVLMHYASSGTASVTGLPSR